MQDTQENKNKEGPENQENMTQNGEKVNDSSTQTEKTSESSTQQTTEKQEWQIRMDKERAARKALFLEYFEKTFCSIKPACEKAGIDRKTYYNWKKDDPEFAEAVDVLLGKVADDVEERFKRFMVKDNSLGLTALTFWLKMRHKDYKSTVKVEHIAPTKTLKQLIEEYEQTNEPANSGESDENKGQKGPDSQVQE